jgi:FHA domain
MGVLRHQTNTRQAILSGEHVIGRLPTSGLVLEASFVSNAHALIRWNGSAWELRDLGSRNGTFLNGRRLLAGKTVALDVSAVITFGATSETWHFVDAAAPTPAAVPMDGGDARFWIGGTLEIPTEEGCASIYFEVGRWILELPDKTSELLPGEVFEAGGRQWQFVCPLGSTATEASDKTLWSLSDATLVFDVSPDEEHVCLSVQRPGFVKELGERNAFYLALVLARQRLEDGGSFSGEHGWMAVDTLLRRVPDYASYSALNIEIFRLRRVLADAGARDASRIIERRRGELRLGTDDVRIRSTMSASAEASVSATDASEL